MQMTALFLDELGREAAATRRVLERVPDGRQDWKPHDKSMPLGRLATLVATLPSWIDLMVNRDEFDLRPPGGQPAQAPELTTGRELAQELDRSVEKGRRALEATNDEHLLKPWRFLVGGHAVSEQPRYINLRDAVFNHLAHHRGQLTVYLRLLGATVPAIYGPSADEGRFE